MAWYRLGESDPDAADGVTVEETLDVLEESLPMLGFGNVSYSSDTPPGTTSTISAFFPGDFDDFLSTDATAWQNQYPGFRVGMEAFVKPDPEMEGIVSVPFGNGSGYWLSIGDDGYFHAHSGGSSTPAGITEVKYGEWQHVAFWTTGSFWQVYVDGVAQYDTLPEFNYGSPGGLATIGADRDGFSEYLGLVDEQRVFTWTGPFDPADLLFFTLKNEGDVNEDGLVNQADYDIWRENVGDVPDGLTLLQGRALGDLNGNRLVDLDDFSVIKANKTPGEVMIVPEPGTGTLLGFGFAWALLVWRRRGR